GDPGRLPRGRARRGAPQPHPRVQEPGAARARRALPARLPAGLRGRALGGAGRPGLRLSRGLHGLPVRVRLPAGGGVRRRVHRLRRRGGLRVRLHPAPAARRAAPGGAHRGLRAGGTRPVRAHGDRRLPRGAPGRHAGRGRSRAARRPRDARAARQRRGDALRHRPVHAGAHDAGGAPRADPRLPDPLHGARLRPARPPRGLDRHGRGREPRHPPARGGPGPARGPAGRDPRGARRRPRGRGRTRRLRPARPAGGRAGGV
ncbi:MAG: hypothetical protein AVDCRST_MAG13-1207, partial [uncultured Solirubrobacteraceae bacterium]